MPHLRAGVAFAALLTLPALAPAFAQAPAVEQAATEQVEEIIVTAERREANLQDVPVSVTAFSAQAIERLGTPTVGALLDFAPNVGRTTGPSGNNTGGFFIRGVGQSDNSISVDPGVGVYIDEIYIARVQASSFDLFDVARVEVLRGPQGTLFGRNTIGGALNVVTQDPTSDLSVRGRAIFGSRNRIEVNGAVSVPLTESTGLRVSGFTRNVDGLGYNPRRDIRFGNVRSFGGRFVLKSDLTDTFTVRLSGDYSRNRGTPQHNILFAFNPQAGITIPRPPQFGGPFFQPGVSPTGIPFPVGVGNDRSSDPYINFASVPPTTRSDNMGLALSITGELNDNLTVRSITGARRYIETIAIDFDATSFPLYDSSNRLKQWQLSQELQLAGDYMDGRLTFLLGAYVFTETNFNDVNLCTGSNRPSGGSGCLLSRNDIDLDTISKAGFANITFELVEGLELVGGIRFTRETKDQSYLSVQDNLAGVPTVLPPQSPIPRPGQVRTVLPFTQVLANFNATTPRLGINWTPTQGVLVYASYAEGFKSGGFTGRPSNAAILPYDPKTVTTYEVGVKSELFDRRLRLNASAFTSDYNQIQLLVFNPATGLFETDNAGDSRIRGFEAEAVARLGPLDLSASVGYLDAFYRSVSPRVQGVSLTDRLPLTSEWTWSASAQYNLALGERAGELQLRADYNYRSTFSFQVENDPLEIQPGYGLLNLRATWVAPESRFTVSAFVTNVTDELFFTNRLDTLAGNGVAFGAPGAPREWGVEVGFRF